MAWKDISSAPRDGTAIQVSEPGWPPYWAKYWTKDMMAAAGDGDAEHGWFQYFPETEADGDVLVIPTLWNDMAPS